MYDFRYNYIKNKFGQNSKLLFTNTDSLTYHINADDVYEAFLKDRDLFDNSDYDKSSKFHFSENKKVIRKFKDEAAGLPITEFVGLKSKTYSYTTENKNNKEAKGVKKNVRDRDIDHSDYLDVLNNNGQLRHNMKPIRSELHEIYSYQMNKISLSCYDDKRYT